MTFAIKVKVDSKDGNIKNECIEALARFLNKKNIYYDVGYDPREIDLDKLGKA